MIFAVNLNILIPYRMQFYASAACNTIHRGADMINVLFVDDEPALLDIARFFLEKKGDIEVSTSPSGEGALSELKCKKFDVIISDYQMPGMNGIDLLKEVYGSGIPFIVFTGKGREEVAIEALNRGAKFYLQKGGDPRTQFVELENMVRHLVKLARAEETAKDNENNYHDLLDNANDLIQSVSPDGRFLYVNKTWLSTLGYDPASLPQLSLSRILKPENRRQCQDSFRRAIFGEDVGIIQATFVAKGGREVIVEGKINCRFENGRPIYTRAIFRDITERSKYEEALSLRENQYKDLYSMVRLMCDNVPDLIWAKDKEKKYIFANKAICERLLNAEDTDEPIGKTDMDFANREQAKHQEDPNWHTFGEICRNSDDVVLTTMKAERFSEFGNVMGKFLFLDVYKAPFRDEAGNLIGTVGCGRDVTKEHAIEEALKEGEAIFRSLVDNMPDATMILYWDGTILFCNNAAANFAGLISPSECIGQNVIDFVHPDYIPLIRKNLAHEGENKGVFLAEYLVRTCQGDLKWVEGLGTQIDFKGKPAHIITLRDITDRKQAREDLLQNNKKLNLLNSITRHDILNQLTVLQGYIEISQEKTIDPVMRENINKERRACETIRRQITFTRDYQNIGIISPQWQMIGDVIKRVAAAQDFGAVKCVIEIDDISLYADPLFEKVFFNIIENSLTHGGNLTEIRFFAENAEGGLRIVCTDDGIGIPVSEKELVFRHRYGRHSGYGLYLAREILSITGLSIKETGIPGKGARFEIFVPEGSSRRIETGENVPEMQNSRGSVKHS